MREARARESREEGETRRRANADAMREARARRIAVIVVGPIFAP